MALPYPTARGRRYGYASIEATFVLPSGAEIITDVSEVGYSHTVEEELQYGTDQAPLGRPPGQYTPGDVTLTVEKQAWAATVDRLGDGYMDQDIDVLITYTGPGLPTLVDTLEKCRVAGSENAHSAGPGALSVNVTLKPMTIIEDGKTPLANHVR